MSFHDAIADGERERKKVLYVRSAYRNESEFLVNQIGAVGDLLDERRINRMIDNDQAVSRNYQRLASQVFDDMEHPERLTPDYPDKLVGPIRDPLRRLFPHPELHTLGNPTKGGTFRFLLIHESHPAMSARYGMGWVRAAL